MKVIVKREKQFNEEAPVIMPVDKAAKIFDLAEKRTGKDLGAIKKAVLMEAWSKADEEGKKKAFKENTEIMVSVPSQIIQAAQREYSKIEEYDIDKLSDSAIKKLSDGAAIRLLDLDNEKAIRNIHRYIRKARHGSMAGGSTAGSILGGVLGAVLGKNVKSASLGAGIGAILGLGGGTALGSSDFVKRMAKRKAYRDGHYQRDLTDRLISKIDGLREGRSNLYGTYRNYRKLGSAERNPADLAED